VEYFSGLDAGGGYRCAEAIGRPLDISGLTATTVPVNPKLFIEYRHVNFYALNFFQKPLGLRWYKVDSATFLVAMLNGMNDSNLKIGYSKHHVP
jgi:hypothetical protein